MWPSEFGQRRPPYFFLLPSYWRSLLPRFRTPSGSNGPGRTAVVDVEAALAQELTPDVERVPDALAQQIRDGSCVYIRGLQKIYKTATGPKHAVDGLNLTMYSGQITALLGHNGCVWSRVSPPLIVAAACCWLVGIFLLTAPSPQHIALTKMNPSDAATKT